MAPRTERFDNLTPERYEAVVRRSARLAKKLADMRGVETPEAARRVLDMPQGEIESSVAAPSAPADWEIARVASSPPQVPVVVIEAGQGDDSRQTRVVMPFVDLVVTDSDAQPLTEGDWGKVAAVKAQLGLGSGAKQKFWGVGLKTGEVAAQLSAPELTSLASPNWPDKLLRRSHGLTRAERRQLLSKIAEHRSSRTFAWPASDSHDATLLTVAAELEHAIFLHKKPDFQRIIKRLDASPAPSKRYGLQRKRPR